MHSSVNCNAKYYCLLFYLRASFCLCTSVADKEVPITLTCTALCTSSLPEAWRECHLAEAHHQQDSCECSPRTPSAPLPSALLQHLLDSLQQCSHWNSRALLFHQRALRLMLMVMLPCFHQQQVLPRHPETSKSVTQKHFQ